MPQDPANDTESTPIGPIHYTLDPAEDSATFTIFGTWYLSNLTITEAATTIDLTRSPHAR